MWYSHHAMSLLITKELKQRDGKACVSVKAASILTSGSFLHEVPVPEKLRFHICYDHLKNAFCFR